MKNKKTLFEYAIGIIFGIMFIIGFLIFATYKPTGDKDKVVIGPVIIWGTMDKKIINKLLVEINDRDDSFRQVKYFEKSKATYTKDILEALASQESPDLILLSNDNFLKNRNKIFSIPQKNITIRDYYNDYADAFSIYVGKDGILGIPFVIDPMVMYYNKNLFSTHRVVVPPIKWEEFEDTKGIVDKIRVFDNSENILKSAISFGEASNVSNFKEILYTLFLQQDNPLVIEGDGVYVVPTEKFTNSSNIIKFYTQFSNQSNKITYSWNKSKPNSEKVFLAEDLGVYFGFSSELTKIRYKNPNLNFDVAEIPSFNNSPRKTVFAKTWVFSIPKASKNKAGALATALELASKESQEILTEKIKLPPVRKDLLNHRHDDLYMDVFYKEAIYASSVLDPDPEQTEMIFKEYVSNVNTGLRQPASATSILAGELEELLKEYEF